MNYIYNINYVLDKKKNINYVKYIRIEKCCVLIIN